MIVGLTGSLGSGKSTVAELFEKHGGARVIDADAICRQVQAPDGSAYGGIVEAFGSEILQLDGTIDRARLASIVFSDSSRREKLNSIVHPEVLKVEKRLLEQYRNEELIVLMVPLLLETGTEALVDSVVVVVVDEESRRRRLFERSGMTPEQVEERLAAQMPDAEKAKRADFVIDNSGTLDKTREQAMDVLKRLQNAARRR